MKDIAQELLAKRTKEPTVDDITDFIKLGKEGKLNLKEFAELDTNFSYLFHMAKEGWEVDKIVKLNEPELMVALIDNEHAQEYYAKWAECGWNVVREALALKGYFPHYFLSDRESYIRGAVIRKYPQYMKYVLKDNELYPRICLVLENEPNPDIETLEAHFLVNYGKLEARRGVNATQYLKAYRLKIEAMKKEVNTMESTMTTAQLYKAGNCLWAQNLSIKQITNVITLENGNVDKEKIMAHFSV